MHSRTKPLLCRFRLLCCALPVSYGLSVCHGIDPWAIHWLPELSSHLRVLCLFHRKETAVHTALHRQGDPAESSLTALYWRLSWGYKCSPVLTLKGVAAEASPHSCCFHVLLASNPHPNPHPNPRKTLMWLQHLITISKGLSWESPSKLAFTPRCIAWSGLGLVGHCFESWF